MKKHILLLLFILAILPSCQDTVVNKFDKTPSARMNDRIKHDLEVLKSAKNGWRMQYYPSKIQAYGGFNLLLKFEDNDKVTAASELLASAVSSSFRIIPETGPVLTFDDYNPVIHYFSNPKNPDGIGAGNTGMEGDYEFIVIEATPDQVILKGKKTANRIVMTPIPEGTKWSDLITSYKQDFDLIDVYTKGEFFLNDEHIASLSKTNATFTFNFNNGEKGFRKSFIKTEKGFDFYVGFDPLDPKNNDKYTEMGMISFEWDAFTETFICLNKDVNAKIVLTHDFYDVKDALGDYVLTYTDVTGADSTHREYKVDVSLVATVAANGKTSYSMHWADNPVIKDFVMKYNYRRNLFEFNVTFYGWNADKTWQFFLLPSTGKTYATANAPGLVLLLDTKASKMTLKGVSNGAAFNGKQATGLTFMRFDPEFKKPGRFFSYDNLTLEKK